MACLLLAVSSVGSPPATFCVCVFVGVGTIAVHVPPSPGTSGQMWVPDLLAPAQQPLQLWKVMLVWSRDKQSDVLPAVFVPVGDCRHTQSASLAGFLRNSSQRQYLCCTFMLCQLKKSHMEKSKAMAIR